MGDRRISVISSTDTLSVHDIRTSINRIRNSIYSLSSLQDSSEFPNNNNEKRWRLSYLKRQFESLRLQELFHRYTQRINHGYFSQFLLIQILLTTLHFIVVFVSNQSSPMEVLPDLILYSLLVVLSIICLIITDIYMKQHPKLLKIFTISSYLILFFADLFIPFYYYNKNGGRIRPAYSTHLIISTYVFLNVQHTLVAFCIGFFTSLIHIVTLILIIYVDDDLFWRRLLTETIFFSCINGLGIYFRHMNEIVKRRSFLDRRSYVESTVQVNFEKEQENRLMSSIIPTHIIDRVRDDIIKFWDNIEQSKGLPMYRPFEHPYLENHENVTILFADIVNYTQMTTQLEIQELLSTLNELFGRFDDASEQLKVLRIKFLGDCYYCVAGLPPEPADNHAEACVNLGLRMISIIADVRKRRNLSIDMRIGIHSGKITSGIIGSIKWQYDIWSNDVDLANKMETEGQPGRVHITEDTKNLLRNSYNMVPYKTVNNIYTYLISLEEDEMNDQNYTETDDSVSNQRLSTIYKKRNILEDRLTGNNTDVEITNGINENNQRRSTIYKKRHPFYPSESKLSNSTSTNNTADDLDNENDEYHRRSTVTRSKRYPIPSILERRLSGNRNLVSISQQRGSLNNGTSNDRRYTDGKRRTAFVYNIQKYEEMLRETSKELENTIENMFLSKYEQWFKVNEMNRVFLTFKNLKTELHFIKTKDPLFKYYVLCALILFICLYFIENLTQSPWGGNSWFYCLTFALIVFVLLPITWTDYLWKRHIAKYKYLTPQNLLLKFLYKTSEFVTYNVLIRIAIYTLVCALFCFCVLLNLVECKVHEEDYNYVKKQRLLDVLLRTNTTLTTYCIVPWHMAEACSLAIITSFIFLRIYMWIKLIVAVLITALYSWTMMNFSENLYEINETINYHIRPEVAHIIIVVFLTINLSLIDRQTEYMNRLDHSWYETLNERQKRVNSIHALNKMLLKNILPIHVAETYLDMMSRFYEPEHYDGVAVMFASLVDYSTEDMGQKFLTVMNQIICDFDMLSVGNTFGRPIEKIKIAKWTYMAACGLAPGLGNIENIRRDQKNHAVISLIKFASALMKQLEKINGESIQNIKLRIGISYGPIVAGVVGSRKPLYDIWGDPVNMASRMDTSGLPNHIQVLEQTAEIIHEFGYVCNYRGRIKIKGPPEPVATYFVGLDKDFNLIRRLDCIS